MKDRISIIAIDDSADDVRALKDCLDIVEDLSIQWIHCSDADEAWTAIRANEVDLILVDYDLVGRAGSELLSNLRQQEMLMSVIAMTDSSDPYIAAEIIRDGADEYIAKEDITTESLKNLIEVAMDRAQTRMLENRLAQKQRVAAEELAELNAELAQAGRYDHLTRLLNRGAWSESIELEHERSTRHNHVYSVIMADIDYFKRLNDTQGHQAGDRVLEQVAGCIAECCRRTDMVGRYGGEEICALLPETDLPGAELLANRICKEIYGLGIPHEASGASDRVTVSIGVACSGSGSAESVIKAADDALYRAKEGGRNQVCTERKSVASFDEGMQDRQIILAVDDDRQYVEILKRHLSKVQNLHFDLHYCMTSAEARSFVVSHRVDMVFIDYELGKEKGSEVLKSLRSTGFLGPMIVLTGHGDEYIATKLMRTGADDYLVKSDLSGKLLRKTINNAFTQCKKRRIESENKQLIEMLQNANDDLEAKNQRLADVNHSAHGFVEQVATEMRHPLDSIADIACTLRKGMAGDLNRVQALKIGDILNRADDLNNMFDDMLEMARLEAGQLSISRAIVSPTMLARRVQPTLTRKSEISDVKLELHIEPGLPDIYCDIERAGRILLNLTKNAIEASSHGDTVGISVKAESEAGQVRFSVADQQRHLTDDEMINIRDGFKRIETGISGDTEGFGLGLTIARDLAHLNFGEIEVDGAARRGCVLSFTVPLADPATLVPRFIERAKCFRSGSKFWHVHEVTFSGEATESLYREVNQLLQYQIRCNDLLLPRNGERWILIAASNRPTANDMIERIARVLENTEQSRSGDPLPRFAFTPRGTFDAHDQKEQLIERVQQIIGTESLAGA